jgi:hypothetical protein
MKSIINRLQLVRLWNSEYSIFVNQIVTIFQKYNPEELHLQKAFGRLTALLPKVDKIKAQELSNILSNSLADLDNERDTLIKAIFAEVKTFGKLSLPSIAIHVDVMKRFLDIHGHDIHLANYNSATERIRDLLNDYDAKAEVRAAALALNLKILFDQLLMVNTQFASKFMQRAQEEATSEKIDVRGIRAETDKVLTSFFDAFEFCSHEYEGLDYATPTSELNDLIGYYKTQLKARTTRRNAGRDVSKEVPIAPSAA